ncbi:MAG: tRNA glutamyl-Q(34) synthetase GluQRS [Rhodospirillales bacterium]
MTTVTRFAPSPTGHLHLGHAFSAVFARQAAGQDGRFLLRIEDIDATRCRPAFTEAIFEDLAWLGLDWEKTVRCQSAHMADYAAVLDNLAARGLTYPCFCTRKDIEEAAGAPHLQRLGPEGLVYPGTCRALSPTDADERIAAGISFALRLKTDEALRQTGPLFWQDRNKGRQAARPELFGDVVLARKDTPTSYHLAVTHDDALQGVTLVTRGEDLFAATHIHRLLQALMDWPVPNYHHHGLLVGNDGKRLAKRDKAATLRALREAGGTAEAVRLRLGFA